MDKKDKTSAEVREDRELVSEEARKLMADGKERKNKSTRKINKLWLWFGVLILVFILLYWIFGIGTFEDLAGVFNG